MQSQLKVFKNWVHYAWPNSTGSFPIKSLEFGLGSYLYEPGQKNSHSLANFCISQISVTHSTTFASYVVKSEKFEIWISVAFLTASSVWNSFSDQICAFFIMRYFYIGKFALNLASHTRSFE